MAGSVNKVILVGNLGRDPEVRRLGSGDVFAAGGYESGGGSGGGFGGFGGGGGASGGGSRPQSRPQPAFDSDLDDDVPF
jgi:single-strand DNA-binding protein